MLYLTFPPLLGCVHNEKWRKPYLSQISLRHSTYVYVIVFFFNKSPLFLLPNKSIHRRVYPIDILVIAVPFCEIRICILDVLLLLRPSPCTFKHEHLWCLAFFCTPDSNSLSSKSCCLFSFLWNCHSYVKFTHAFRYSEVAWNGNCFFYFVQQS